MTVKKVYSRKGIIDLSKKDLHKDFFEIIEYGILASQEDPFDPMEKALKNLGKKVSFEDKYGDSCKLIKDFPLTKSIKATSEVWETDKETIVATKGAPETIIELCHLHRRESERLYKDVAKMASEGLRIIGVAKAKVKNFDDKMEVKDFKFEFVGFLGFEDPVRPGVAAAIKECYNAGIKVVMITGDYPITAKNIGLQIGLEECETLTGEELDKMSDSQLKKRISNVCIFARVVPEQKLRIVNALKANGEITVMTGDGVNDAPALKSANIGIAMGMRGTDVAREASGIVILDDDFSSIVEGVKIGRRIFDNIRKAMNYVFAIHFPIAGITFLAVLFGWPLILFPAHIVFLELIIDPSCSIVFEAEKEEKDIMKRKPRSPKEKIFNKETLLLGFFQGLAALIVTVIIFKLSLYLGSSEGQARAITFSTLIVSNLGLIMSNLSWKESIFHNLKTDNKALIYVLIGAIGFLFLTIYTPFLGDLFSFEVIGLKDWGLIIIGGLMAIGSFEIFKKVIVRE
jgi:P-type Ca2+ transporter type 2C